MKPILKQVQEELSCPFRATKMVTELNLPTSLYPVLAAPPMKAEVHKNGSVEYSQATVEGVPILSLIAPMANFKHLWKSFEQMFPLTETGKNSFALQLKHAIEFFFKTPAYSQYIADPSNLEIIIRGDGFPVGGKHAVFLLVTLGNFGIRSKCLAFNLPINVAEIDEKNRPAVKQAFKDNLKFANEINKTKCIEFGGRRVKARVEFGGDEAFLRMMLGLQACSELHACIKCLWHRDTEYCEELQVDRVLSMMKEFYVEGLFGQKDKPLIQHALMHQIHHCAMHAIIPFGKDLLAFCFRHLQQLQIPAVTAAANAWLKTYRISYVDMLYHLNLQIFFPFLQFFVFLQFYIIVSEFDLL